ncbi:MAG: response regulator [Elusimicrobia bacterium]|nr:response regulator [Elusimicrobiota bacterium]
MTILVADDNPAILRLLERFLRPRGFRVFVAKTGEELLTLWKEIHCEVVLSDIQMPRVLNGIQACRVIQSEDPRVRVFLMTGSPELRETAKASGFPLAFLKPFTLDQLRKWAESLPK